MFWRSEEQGLASSILWPHVEQILSSGCSKFETLPKEMIR